MPQAPYEQDSNAVRFALRVQPQRLHLTVFLPGGINALGLLGLDEKFALLQGRQIFPFALGRRCATRRRIGSLPGLHLLTVLILVVRRGTFAQGQSEDACHRNNQYLAHHLLLDVSPEIIEFAR
jgi:hypothetical protein